MKKDFFAQAIKKGKHFTNRETLSMAVGGGEENQPTPIAIATKKKLGNAVIRNRIRRRLKAALAKLKIKKGKRVVVFPFIMAKNKPFPLLCADVEKIFKEAELLM